MGMDEPCKGDTLSKPRAQALGQSLKHIYVSPFRGGTILSKANAHSVSAAPAELLILVSPIYPGFHFGLRPHFTLGYEKVSCLKALMPASPDKSNK